MFSRPDSCPGSFLIPVCASLGVKTLAFTLLLELWFPALALAEAFFWEGPLPCPYGISGILAAEGGFRELLKLTAGAVKGSAGALLD